MKVEVCVDSIESCLEAIKGGANRLELCSSLFLGGLTPSYGMMKVVKSKIPNDFPVYIMIRPRSGDFLYSSVEIECMKVDIIAAKELGYQGVVFGCLDKDGRVDIELLKDLVQLSKPMSVTFHRAFDMCRDHKEALMDINEVSKRINYTDTTTGGGIERILTSGLESTVLEGIYTIKECLKWVENNKSNLIIVPGGGITERNLSRIIKELSPLLQEFHISGRITHDSKMIYRNQRVFMGGELRASEFSLSIVDHNKIERFLDNIK